MKSTAFGVLLAVSMLLVTGGQAEASEPTRGQPTASGTVTWRAHNPPEKWTLYPGENGDCWALEVAYTGSICVTKQQWYAHPWGSYFDGPYLRTVRM
jgi:hypothetical protein